ncbi:MAG: cyclic nucleotide-binding domain-containing protein [Desulfobacteraceae bacterium]|nr:cyclic nucleotide-binding domain-containing protein [Desulfobacteraceae bacterium]
MVTNDLVKRFSVFSKVSEEMISRVAKCGEVLDFDPRQRVFAEGDIATALYGVLEGEVELSIMVRDRILKTEIKYEESLQSRIETIEKSIVVDSIAAGEIFGWSAMIPPGVLTSTAICSAPTRLLALPARDLKALFDADIHLGFFFMEELSQIVSNRLRNRTRRLIESWGQAFAVNKIEN